MALIGTICSVKPANSASPQRFILRNENGFFSIHLEPEPAAELGGVIQPGVAVCVLGLAQTYYQPRRRTHQVIVRAISIHSLEPEPLGSYLSPALIALVKFVTEQVTQMLAASPGVPGCPQGEIANRSFEWKEVSLDYQLYR